jgi:hypothetical protein
VIGGDRGVLVDHVGGLPGRGGADADPERHKTENDRDPIHGGASR